MFPVELQWIFKTEKKTEQFLSLCVSRLCFVPSCNNFWPWAAGWTQANNSKTSPWALGSPVFSSKDCRKAQCEVVDTWAIAKRSRLGGERKTTLNHSFLWLNTCNIKKKWYQRGLDHTKTKVSWWNAKDRSHICPPLAASCSRAFMRTERCRLQPTWPWARTDGGRSRLLSDSAQIHAVGCQSPSSSYTPAINTLQPPDRVR